LGNSPITRPRGVVHVLRISADGSPSLNLPRIEPNLRPELPRECASPLGENRSIRSVPALLWIIPQGQHLRNLLLRQVPLKSEEGIVINSHSGSLGGKRPRER